MKTLEILQAIHIKVMKPQQLTQQKAVILKEAKTASTTRRAVHTMTGQPTRLKCFVQLKKLKPPATGRQNDKQKAPESLELLLFHNDDLITFL